jgi:hypothetical protein
MAHIGGMILSMARRIMNEPMNLANALGIYIMYQDTDSMHLVDSLNNNPSYIDKLQILQDMYYDMYDRKLVGEELGQFGFDLKYPDHHTIYSRKALFLGKKVYLHIVDGTNNEGNIESYNYARMKGINSHALSEYKDYYDLYLRMYEGEEIKFDLAYGDAVVFDFKDAVTTRDSFIKTISFDGERCVL